MRIYVETLPGYENIMPGRWYVDSEDGELHGPRGILKGSWERDRKYAYKSVSLRTIENKQITKRKCRIIALALVDGRTAERNEVDHINGKHGDDRPENLRWVTRQENADNRSLRRYRQGQEPKKRRKKESQIDINQMEFVL